MIKRKIKKIVSATLALAMIVAPLGQGFFAEAATFAETDFQLLPQNNMKVLEVSSEYTGVYGPNPGELMVDGNKDTFWETDWDASVNGLPAHFLIDLGKETSNVSRLVYTPRQSGNNLNGAVTKFEIYAGNDKDNLALAGRGTWAVDSSRSDKTATFASTTARYIKMVILDTATDEKTASAAEINIGTKEGFTIDYSELDAAVQNARDALAQMDDPDLKKSIEDKLAAIEEARAALVQEEVAKTAEELTQFIEDNKNPPVDEDGFAVISNSALSVAYVRSTAAETSVSNMLDGKDNTFWESNYVNDRFIPGDCIIWDLGSEIPDISRLYYMPRQDMSNGRIKSFEILTSTADSINPENPLEGFVSSGKGAWDTTSLEKTATFPSVAARFVAIKVYSVGGDGATITCAGIRFGKKKGVTVDMSLLESALGKAWDEVNSLDNEIAKQKISSKLQSIEGNIYIQEGLESALSEIQDTLDTYASMGKVQSIRPGKVWVDDTGEAIQAHGGGILFDEKTKTYYWYGEHKGFDNISTGAETGTPAVGISCYSSKDLYNWKNEGVALPVFNNPYLADGTAVGDDTPMYMSEQSQEYKDSSLQEHPGTAVGVGGSKSPFESLSKFHTDAQIEAMNALYSDLDLAQKKELYKEFNWNRVVERPKVIYNEKTDKYIMWWHQDGPTAGQYSVASAGIAISDTPTGPFKYLRTTRLPDTGFSSANPGMLRDMTLFVDDDGTAYVIFSSEENATTVIQKLDETYTDISGTTPNKDYKRIFIGEYREAPTMFKQGNDYYMITSGQSGWNPNPCKYHVSTNGILGDWETKGFFCIDDINLNDEVVTDPGSGTTYRSQSTFILPMRDADGEVVDGKFIYLGDRWFRENLQDSRYIWLPIHLDTESRTLSMKWTDSWTLEKEMGTGTSVTDIELKSAPAKTKYYIGEELDLSGAVITVYMENGNSEDKDVTSDMISGYDKNQLGEQTVTVTYKEKTTTFKVTVSEKPNPLKGIELKTGPSKTTYTAGEELDLTGAVLTLIYAQGTKEIPVTASMVSGFVSAKAGTQTLTITYEDMKTTFTVIVKERPAPPVIPDAPGQPKVQKTTYNSITISYTKPTGVHSFVISMTDTKTKKITKVSTSKTSYTFKKLVTGRKYRFRVYGIYRDANGKDAEISCTKDTVAAPKPAAPGKLKAKKAGKTSLRISWKKTAGASSYKVYYKLKSSKKFKIVKAKSNKYTLKKLKKGKKYQIKVVAVRKKYAGNASKTITAKI